MAKVGLEGDKQAQASLKDLDLKLTKLKAKTADPDVTVKGLESAFFGIGRLDVALDKIGAKHVTANVDVKVNRSGLRGLLSGVFSGGGGGPAGGGGGGGAGGVGSLFSGGLTSPIGIGAIAAGGSVAAALVPSVVGLGLGGIAGLGAIGGGVYGAAQGKKVLAADLANIKTITTSLKTAIGQQKKDLSQALKDANKQYAKDAAFFQPFTNFQDAIKGLEKTIIAPLRPIMAPLTALFVQFGKGLTALGPQFTALFRASLPFTGQFLKFMLQAGKILLPAFTQALNEMVKSGALKQMTDALVILTQGLATFIVNLGPGMAASAHLFKNMAESIGQLLGFLGEAFTVFARVIAFDLPADVHQGVNAVGAAFTSLGRMIVGALTTLRGFIGGVWNTIWRNTTSIVQHGVSNVLTSFGALRSGIAGAWNTIWNNTVTRVQSGITTVVGFFRGLPGRALSALSGLGTSLYNFAHQALVKFGNGAKAVWSSITKWFSGLPSKILHALGIHSPPDWAISAGRHVMQGILKGLHLGTGGITGFISGLTGRIGALFGSGPAGRAGGGVQQWRGLVLKALRMEHLPAGLVNDVLYQMQTESGGRANAINLTDSNARAGVASRGLMQVIPPTFAAYHWPGTSWNIFDPLANIAAALNYGAHNGRGFGSGPGQIGSGHGYDRGGWLMPGVTMAVNTTGRPELVTPNSGPGSMAEVTALLRQLIAATQAAPARSGVAFARELNGSATRALR